MRLSSATISALPAAVARPDYDRSKISRGVVHLGIGAFHRAHQAAVFDAALSAGDLRWGVTGVSLRSPTVRDQLAPQDCLYTLAVRDGSDEALRVIGAVMEVLVAPEDPAAVVAAIASPETHLVTLTVTEKGYKLNRTGEGLIAADDDVAHDLASLAAPRTAPGLIAAGLMARWRAGLAGLTILSCDNLPGNGALLRRGILAMAAAQDAAFHDWVTECVCFPVSMVDRIVPATTDEDIAALHERTAVEDRAMVKTEPFFHWVIEDRFSGPRPDFAALGVHLTRDVAPWEEAKLRLLNGAHSGIAYLGGLAGVEFVHEFVAMPRGRAFVEALWNESAPTLNAPDGLDLAVYRTALMARFANPALSHRTRQIAQDGSQKLPQRLVAPLAERRAGEKRPDALALAIAAWMRWQGGVDDFGTSYVVDDPLAANTALALAGASSTAERVTALLLIPEIFPATWLADGVLVTALVEWLDIIERHGAGHALEQLAVR